MNYEVWANTTSVLLVSDTIKTEDPEAYEGLADGYDGEVEPYIKQIEFVADSEKEAWDKAGQFSDIHFRGQE